MRKTAIVITAIPEEAQAVTSLFHVAHERTVAGIPCVEGQLFTQATEWNVYLVMVGPGQAQPIFVLGRLLSELDPDIAAFVGIAGGIRAKGVSVGDVIVASKIYLLNSGVESPDGFLPRTDTRFSTQGILLTARNHVVSRSWPPDTFREEGSLPRLYVEPIVSGNVLVRYSDGPTRSLIEKYYSDACVIEMEGWSFLASLDFNESSSPACVIRGISDLLDDQSGPGYSANKQSACRNAASYFRHLLASLPDRRPEAAEIVVVDVALTFAGASLEMGPKMLEEIRIVTGADSAAIRTVRRNSIVIQFEVSYEDFKKIKRAIEDGKLTAVLGHELLAAEVLSGTNETLVVPARIEGRPFAGVSRGHQAESFNAGLESSERLVNRAMEGNSNAFDTLLERCRDGVRSRLQTLTGDRKSAEEVLSDAEPKVFQSLGMYKPGPFCAWMWVVVRNSYLDSIRVRRREAPFEEWLVECLADTSENPEADAINSDLRRALRDCISRLPDQMKVMCQLKFENELTLHQIAITMLQRTDKKAQFIVDREITKAKKALRHCLQAKGYGPD